MAANSKVFPWPPHYGHFNFFEQRMKGHGAVATLEKREGGIYDLTLKSGKTLKVFICECYSYGVAEYMESVEKLGPLNAIIINSAWCGYTTEAKRLCRDRHVGLFNIRDFMGSLSKADFWLYLNEGDTKVFKKNGWL